MSQFETTSVLRDIFVDSCISLFDSLGCDVSPVEPDEEALGDAPFGLIDAGSDDLEFTIALRLPLSVLVMTYPLAEEATDETLEDWISELSNQLIGRIKRGLLQYDHQVKIGLPMALFGADIEEAMPAAAMQFSAWLSVDRELCECRMALEIFNPALVLTQVSQDDGSSSEGELEFF